MLPPYWANLVGPPGMSGNPEQPIINGYYPTEIRNNQWVGISVGNGSRVNLSGDVHILDNGEAGIDVFHGSQLATEPFIDFYGTWTFNDVVGNGTGVGTAKAGIRVDGNSEAHVYGVNVNANQGPGVFLLLNSTADAQNSNFNSNSGGSFVCDRTSYVTADVPVPDKCQAPVGSFHHHNRHN